MCRSKGKSTPSNDSYKELYYVDILLIGNIQSEYTKELDFFVILYLLIGSQIKVLKNISRYYFICVI